MGGRHQDTDMSVAAAYAAGETFEAPVRATRIPHQPRVSASWPAETQAQSADVRRQ
jgi:hypothetical protein